MRDVSLHLAWHLIGSVCIDSVPATVVLNRVRSDQSCLNVSQSLFGKVLSHCMRSCHHRHCGALRRGVRSDLPRRGGLDIEGKQQGKFTINGLNIQGVRSAQIKLIAKLRRAGGARRSLRLVQGGACAGAVARAGRRDERAASPCFWIAGNRRFDRYMPGAAGLDGPGQ